MHLLVKSQQDWDRVVNDLESGSVIIDTPREFYLNYVECKSAKHCLHRVPVHRFYLNYVECKSVLLDISVISNHRFI